MAAHRPAERVGILLRALLASAWPAVRPRPGAAVLLHRLRHALRATLPNFMQPRSIVWQRQLPRNANGKIDRVTIAANWAGDRAA